MQSDYIMIIIRLAIIKKVITNAAEVLPYIDRDSFSGTLKRNHIYSPFKESKKSEFEVCVSDLLYSQY